jgi:hypothetical protein
MRPIVWGVAGGGLRVGALVLAVVLLAAAAPASAHTRVKVLTRTQAALRDSGQLRVRVHTGRPGTVRVRATALGRGITAWRTVRFPHWGAHNATLRLNATGRRLAHACGRLRVRASARRHAPAQRFTSRGRALRPDGRGCYRIGLGMRSINPAADGKFHGKPVYLGGYGFGGPPAQPGRPATGILGDGAQVRAVALSDGRRQLVVADIEEQGWFAATKDGPYGLVDLRRQVAKATGGAVPAERVLIQSDHTHSGADTIGVWGGVPKAYRIYVMRQTLAAILAALRAERPGSLYYGTAPARDLLSNQFDYDKPNKVVDSDVRVLQARDPGGRPFVTLLNFSAHATVLGSSNTKLTGDWPTRANRLMQRRFGGRAATMVGTLGRTQPADRGCPDKSRKGDAESLCSLDAYATRVVSRAARAARGARQIGGKPLVDARSYLIRDPSTNPVILGLDYVGDPVGTPIYRSLTPPWLAGNVLGTTTATARIGDVLLSAMPGEAYPQIPLKVRALVPKLRGYMTAGLADDQLGYLIAPYEAYPEPIRRTFFNQRGDEVSPIDNDNYAFNVSPTIGDRVTCSLLRGAGELTGKGSAYRSAYDRCATFANDELAAPGADVQQGSGASAP